MSFGSKIFSQIKNNLGTMSFLIVGVGTVIIDFFDDTLVSPDILTKIQIASTFMIIWLFIDNSPEQIAKNVEEAKDTIDNGNNLLQSKMAELLSFQKNKVNVVYPKEQPEIFKNFKGIYYSVNAPVFIEDHSVATSDDILNSHVARYKDPEFSKIYNVFYLPESNDPTDPFYYENAIDNFYKFNRKLFDASEEVKSKSRVVLIQGRAPSYSLYLGTKNIEHIGMYNVNINTTVKKMLYSIIYFGDEPFTTFQGNPKFAFASVDEALNSILKVEMENLISRSHDIEYDLSLGEFLDWYENENKVTRLKAA